MKLSVIAHNSPKDVVGVGVNSENSFKLNPKVFVNVQGEWKRVNYHYTNRLWEVNLRSLYNPEDSDYVNCITGCCVLDNGDTVVKLRNENYSTSGRYTLIRLNKDTGAYSKFYADENSSYPVEGNLDEDYFILDDGYATLCGFNDMYRFTQQGVLSSKITPSSLYALGRGEGCPSLSPTLGYWYMCSRRSLNSTSYYGCYKVSKSNGSFTVIKQVSNIDDFRGACCHFYGNYLWLLYRKYSESAGNSYFLEKYNSSGSLIWSKNITKDLGNTYLNIVSDGTNAYITSFLGSGLYKFDSDGNLVWKNDVFNNGSSSLIYFDGTYIYSQSNQTSDLNGNIVAKYVNVYPYNGSDGGGEVWNRNVNYRAWANYPNSIVKFAVNGIG